MREVTLIKLSNALSKIYQPRNLDLPAQVETFPTVSRKPLSMTEYLRVIKAKLSSDYQILVWAVCLGLIHGLLYISLVPPWQHYDEPSHFEFAWLIANDRAPADKDTYDLGMRRELAASMIEHDFFNKIDNKPNLLSQEDEIWIGVSQVNYRSLYYLLAAVPLRIIKTSDITFQLYVVRSVSLFLFLLTIASAWGIAREVTGPGHPLRWMLPFSIALLPGFVDIMSAVNDDVGATALFSLFLWLGCYMIMRGFTWLRFIMLVSLALLCYWVKTTVTISIFLIFIPVFFSLKKEFIRRIAWGFLGVGVILFLSTTINWGDAAYWIRINSPDVSARARSSSGPVGNFSFRIASLKQNPPTKLVQVIPGPISQNLRGTKVTLGSWIWADEPVIVRTPLLVTSNETFFKEVEISDIPKFFTLSAVIDDRNSKLNVMLSPQAESPHDVNIYYDGILMVEGRRPKSSIPIYNDADGLKGEWGNEPFTNILRNGSAENVWPWISNWADQLFSEIFGGRLSLYLAFFIDHGTASNYYRATLERLFESFWAGFGWGNIHLIGSQSFLILGIVTLSGILGAIVSLVRNHKRIPWNIVVFLSSTSVFILGSTVMRGTGSIIDGRYLFPVARYLYPAIIPLMMMLNIGWLEVFHWSDKVFKIPTKIKIGLFGCFFLGLNVLGIMTISQYYFT